MAPSGPPSSGLSARTTIILTIVAVVLAGTFTVVGTIIGGRISNHGAERVVRLQVERDNARRKADIRGIGRLTVLELATAGLTMDTLRIRRRLVPLTRHFEVEVKSEDLKRLASALSPGDWQLLRGAIGTLEEYRGLINQLVLGDHRLKMSPRLFRLTTSTVNQLHRTIDALENAADA
jgi:hypothetical protein